jgi:type I protein arginine methyltransferase
VFHELPGGITHSQISPQRVESQSDDWSEEEDGTSFENPPQDLNSALRKIKFLETRLQKANQNLVDYREFIAKQLYAEKITKSIATTMVDPIVTQRDDDSHYFTSYGSNGAGVLAYFA